MSELYVGSHLKDYSELERSEWNDIIHHYDDINLKGITTEKYLQWVLSLFDGVLIPTERGSSLDKLGVDILMRGTSLTFGIQIKSSAHGVNFFKDNGKLSEEILLLWVDVKSRESRRNLFKSLLKILPNLGCPLKLEVKELLILRNRFLKANVRNFIITNKGTNGISEEKLRVLLRVGLAYINKGYYII
ncbi:hypothetical protein V6O07_00450 [Arthrospira platensis SPKY2]